MNVLLYHNACTSLKQAVRSSDVQFLQFTKFLKFTNFSFKVRLGYLNRFIVLNSSYTYDQYLKENYLLLNQVQAGHRLEQTWFIKIASAWTSVSVCVCVCLPLRLLITSGMMWCDMDSVLLVKQRLQLIWQL